LHSITPGLPRAAIASAVAQAWGYSKPCPNWALALKFSFILDTIDILYFKSPVRH